MSVSIVVLPRSWVVVGKLAEGEWCQLEGASVIRRWGTSKGLGEIAINGPGPNTILDPTPPQRFPKSAVLFTIACDADKWAKFVEHK